MLLTAHAEPLVRRGSRSPYSRDTDDAGAMSFVEADMLPSR